MTQAIETCRQSIALHSKSFTLAAKLLGPRTRDAAAVVYAWCRRADDAIDSTSGPEQQRALATLRRELESLYAGDAQVDPVLSAFRHVVDVHGIPRRYPEELLAGMEMDACGASYPDVEELLLYCYRVASTVGLMMCHVLGVSDAAALRHAAHLGVAMQLTNVARDVREDWQRGRLYLPDDLLHRHRVGGLRQRLGGPLPGDAIEGCRGVLRELLALAERYYASGDAGLRYLDTRSSVSVAAAREVYAAIGARLAQQDHDVLAPRAYVPKPTALALCLRACVVTLWRRWSPRSASFQPVPLHTLEYGTDVVTL